MKKIPKEIKRNIKQDVKNRIQYMNSMTSKPVEKIQNKIAGAKATRALIKDARQSGEYDPYTEPSREPARYAKMKTGGMVNSNAKVSVSKSSKGRPAKSAEPKSVVKKPTGKVGGISKAPKSANPKSK